MGRSDTHMLTLVEQYFCKIWRP